MPMSVMIALMTVEIRGGERKMSLATQVDGKMSATVGAAS